MKLLSSKKVLITGGTTGIGRATAVLLAQNGADVFIFGRHQRELNDALSDVKKLSGKEGMGVVADVADADSIKRVFDKIDQKWGGLDILINNAALPARSITNYSIDDIHYILNVNIAGYLICAKFALEKMLPEGRGHIVNVGSMSACVREAEADLYVATKSAIAGFNESLRKLVNKECVKVSIIEPGSTGTDMISESPEEQIVEEERLNLLKAEDIAECILFCLTRPARCDIVALQVKPHYQIL